MRYLLISISLCISIQAFAKSGDTTFLLKGHTKHLAVSFNNNSRMILSDSIEGVSRFVDTQYLKQPDSVDAFIDFLERWGADTLDKDYVPLLTYLVDSLKWKVPKRKLTQRQVPFRQETVASSPPPSKPNWQTLTLYTTSGVALGFLLFTLTRLTVISINRRKSAKKYPPGNPTGLENNPSDPQTPENKGVFKDDSVSMLPEDMIAHLNQLKIRVGHQTPLKEIVEELLRFVTGLQKKSNDDKKVLDRLEVEKADLESDKSKLIHELSNVQKQFDQISGERDTLSVQLTRTHELSAQDDHIVQKALEWVNRGEEDAHVFINKGDVRGANRQILSNSISGLLLFSSYLGYRRKIARSLSKDSIGSQQKPVEMDPNLRILLGEKVELKQPGPAVNDAPPLTGQLREIARQLEIPELAPFGYGGYKIKS